MDDIEKFKELIKEKNISTIEEMQKESTEFVKKIAHLKEKHDKIILARGTILELSTILEVAYNELITKTGGEDLVINPEKKELNFITGMKTERELGGISSFAKKTDCVKEAMKKVDEAERNSPNTLFEDMDICASVRDIFAHVPINWLSQELEFNCSLPYKHFFKNPQWKIIEFAISDFIAANNHILEAIPVYIKLILLKEELMRVVFLGTDCLKDIKQEDKKKS